MDRIYWIGRQAAASAMARGAASAKARLIHYELAGRYGLKAAQCPAFMVPEPAAAAPQTRAVLHLPGPAAPGQPPLVR